MYFRTKSAPMTGYVLQVKVGLSAVLQAKLLKLIFSNVNLHYDLDNNISYNNELSKEATKIKTCREITNIIINFYSYSNKYDINTFNKIIGNNNLHKLETEKIKVERGSLFKELEF